MIRAVCSGSFDPVTLGHIDIFTRGAEIFDEIIVCIFHNVRKRYLFSVEERLSLLREATEHLKNVRIDSYSGLIPDYMKKVNATVLLRGIRSSEDFAYEMREARMVNYLDKRIETLFLPTNPIYSHISSSAVRELAAFDRLPAGLVTESVEKAVKRKLAEHTEKRD